ncbi:MAG: HIT domain-containing protein [archaeon]|jgi:histidine triad (HIT) family protein
MKEIYNPDCLFCKFCKHEMDTAIVYENDYVICFLDINPAGTLEGHTLVVVKEHCPSIETCSEKTLAEAMKAIKQLIPTIKKVSGAEAINVLNNNGKEAGQLIPHTHFHIIPRKHGDGIRFEENRRPLKPMEQIEVAKAIKEELQTQD